MSRSWWLVCSRPVRLLNLAFVPHDPVRLSQSYRPAADLYDVGNFLDLCPTAPSPAQRWQGFRLDFSLCNGREL